MVPQQYTIPQSSITPSSTNYNQTHADEEDSRVEDSNCTCSLNAIMKRKSNCNNYLQIQQNYNGIRAHDNRLTTSFQLGGNCGPSAKVGDIDKHNLTNFSMGFHMGGDSSLCTQSQINYKTIQHNGRQLRKNRHLSPERFQKKVRAVKTDKIESESIKECQNGNKIRPPYKGNTTRYNNMMFSFK